MPLLVLICGMIVNGCGSLNSIAERFDNRMAETIRSMDAAIAQLAQQSADWQVVVANLEKEISKDVQSTLRTEIHDLTRSAVLSTGAEAGNETGATITFNPVRIQFQKCGYK